jgi:hypothetical protein
MFYSHKVHFSSHIFVLVQIFSPGYDIDLLENNFLKHFFFLENKGCGASLAHA